MSTRARAASAAVGLGAAFSAGCAQPPGGFESPVPDARLKAIAQASETKDPAAVPHLIEALLSDDPLVRMTSINTLESITGQTLGYHYWDAEEERRARVQDWVEWYRRQQGGAGAAGGGPKGGGEADRGGRDPS